MSLDTLTGLDDLLEPEPTRHSLADRLPPAGGLRRRALRVGLTALVLGTGLWGLAASLGLVVPYPLAVLLVLVLVVLTRIVRSLATPSLPVVTEPLRLEAPDERDVPPDGLALAVNGWGDGLNPGEKDRARAAALQPRLRLVVDERLRQRHGVTLTGDPARARGLLGERLWELLHVPLTRTPPPRELAAIVAQIEAL